ARVARARAALRAAVAAGPRFALGLARRALRARLARAPRGEGAPPAIVAAGAHAALDALVALAARARLFVRFARCALPRTGPGVAGARVGRARRAGVLAASDAHAGARDAGGDAVERAVGRRRAAHVAAALGIRSAASRIDALARDALGVARGLARTGARA